MPALQPMPGHKIPDDDQDGCQHNDLCHDQSRAPAQNLLDVWLAHLDSLKRMGLGSVEKDQQRIQGVTCRDEKVKCEEERNDELDSHLSVE